MTTNEPESHITITESDWVSLCEKFPEMRGITCRAVNDQGIKCTLPLFHGGTHVRESLDNIGTPLGVVSNIHWTSPSLSGRRCEFYSPLWRCGVYGNHVRHSPIPYDTRISEITE